MSGTGGVDDSIALQAGKGVGAPQNPLQTIGQFVGVQNALNQNKLFPGQLQQQGIATQGQQLALSKAQNSAAYQSALPVVANPNFTLDDLTGSAGSAEKNLGIPTHQLVNDVAALPMAPNTPEWRQAVKNIVVSRSQTDPGTALATITPTEGPQVDQGPVITPTVRSPAGSLTPGQIAPAGQTYGKGLGPQFVGTGAGNVPTNNGAPVGSPISNQLSPAQLATPTQIGVDKNGAPVMGTLDQFLGKTGASPLGTGRLPAALLGAGSPHAGVVTGVGPASQAALTTQGTTSAKAFQDIADQGVQARSQNSILGNMLADTANFTTGPTSLNINKATLMRYAPAIAQTFGIAPDAVAANESFDKLANQIAGAQGERSDARLSVAQGANPSSHLSQAGADLMLRQLQGNADYLQTRAKLAAEYPDQTDRAGFESKVGGMLDPRAFQYDRMTPAQRKTYASSLSTKDQKIVRDSYNSLHAGGFLGAQ